jgi:hypothetical protein
MHRPDVGMFNELNNSAREICELGRPPRWSCHFGRVYSNNHPSKRLESPACHELEIAGFGRWLRSRVEHVFGVVKRLWGFGKVRYRGLQKNATRAFTALALANIYLGRQRLMAQVRP